MCGISPSVMEVPGVARGAAGPSPGPPADEQAAAAIPKTKTNGKGFTFRHPLIEAAVPTHSVTAFVNCT